MWKKLKKIWPSPKQLSANFDISNSDSPKVCPLSSKSFSTAEYFRADLDRLIAKYGFKEPDRGNLDDEMIKWREGKPDYTKVTKCVSCHMTTWWRTWCPSWSTRCSDALKSSPRTLFRQANFEFLTGKTQNHAAGSLEEVVENLVKSWESEASHKVVSRLYFCARKFLSKKEYVHLLSSSIPCLDKCHETSRTFPRTEQTFASARSFVVISWASFSGKNVPFGFERLAPSASQKAL